MLLFYDFIDEIRSQKFNTYKAVIDFLENYQNPVHLERFINKISLLNQANTMEDKTLGSLEVCTAIERFTQNNEHYFQNKIECFPIDLSDGAGSFDCFDGIPLAIADSLKTSRFHHYQPAYVDNTTLCTLNDWAIFHGFDLNEYNSTRTNWHIYSGGVTRACAEVFKLLNKEDTILFATPTYGNLIPLASQYAKVQLIPLSNDTQWKLTPNLLQKHLKPNAKHLLVFVNPANPTGLVYTQEEINALAKMLLNFDCLVLDDRVHQGLEFHETQKAGLFQASTACEQTFTIFGPSKTHCAAGWRLGILHVQNAHHAKLFKNNFQFSDYSHCKLYEAMIRACYGKIDHIQNYLNRNNLEYQLRHKLLTLFVKGEAAAKEIMHGELLIKYIYNLFPEKASSFLRPAAGLSLLTEPQSGFFQLLGFAGWKNKRLGNFQIKTSSDIYQVLQALNILTLPDVVQGFRDEKELSLRISVSNSFLPYLQIDDHEKKAQNIVSHYILGAAFERIKSAAKLLE